MLRRATILVAATFLWPAQAAAPQPQSQSESISHYVGEARIGGEAPFPVHMTLRRSGAGYAGLITTESGSYEFVAGGVGPIEGTLSGGEATGSIRLSLRGAEVEGEFELGGQQGTLALNASSLDARAFFQEPDQRSDLSTAQWTEDLDRLVDILTRRHASPFHRTDRVTFEREVAQVRQAIPGLSGPEVAMAFRRLAGLIGDGHTSVGLLPDRPRYQIAFYWFDDGLRVTGIAEEHRALLGARLTSIGGLPVEELTAKLRGYMGHENEWGYRAGIPWMLAHGDTIRAVGAGAAQTEYVLETPDGRLHSLRLTASEPTPRARLGDGPLWQREREQGFRNERWADGTVYVNWRTYDRLSRQASALMSDLDKQPPRKLIIDLRDNSGGDFNRGRSFVREIARRPQLNRKGRLFVLTGRTTFSAAMTNAVDFLRETEATLIGEPAGAAPNNWQEGRSFTLPNSGLSVSVSTKYYEFLPGTDALHPHIHIPPAISDWTSERDRAVEHVLNLKALIN